MNTMTFLNRSGDITLAWDDTDNERMRAIVDKKLKEGYTFFIVKRNFLGIKSKQKIKTIDDIRDNKIIMDDNDLETVLAEKNNVYIVNPNNVVVDQRIEPVKRAKTTDEVVKHDTVAVRPMKGG